MKSLNSLILDNHIIILFFSVVLLLLYFFYENYFMKKETDSDWFEKLVIFHIIAKNRKKWDIVGKRIPISTDKSYIIKNSADEHTRIFKE